MAKRKAEQAGSEQTQAKKQQKQKQKHQAEELEVVPLSEVKNLAAASVGGKDGKPAVPGETFKNKEKVLVLSTRGITFRFRHLLEDLMELLPHSKKESKLDTKSDRGVINEVADLKGCNSVIFFEVRKKQDLYIWMAKSPRGPCVKFFVTNIHTMAELKLSGNHLKGSRPVLSFHKAFDEQPHLQVLKEMLAQIFGTPKKHHKSKPFFDHVLNFSVADNRVWLRNYQVVVPEGKKSDVSLVEVGPRLCLQPIKIFAGSFGGPTLYDNPDYVSPNAVRAALRNKAATKYTSKVLQKQRHESHKAANPLPRDDMDGLFAGGEEASSGDDE